MRATLVLALLLGASWDGYSSAPTLPAQATIAQLEIRVGDFVFDALAAGPADGDLVLLLHGFPQTADAYRFQLKALGAAGYRAVAPNQRGYSPRARPDGVAPYAVPNLVADVIGMADALGARRFHLVGHDWGGAVAWVAAMTHPDRLITLTVLSTPHVAAMATARSDPESEQSKRSSYFATFSKPGAEKMFLDDDAAFLRRIYADFDEDLRDRYMAALANPEALRAALAWYAATFGGSSPSSGPSATPTPTSPPAIPVPTLYVFSPADQAFSRDTALATAKYVSGPYRYEEIEGVGHWLPELAAERVTALILEQLKTEADSQH